MLSDYFSKIESIEENLMQKQSSGPDLLSNKFQETIYLSETIHLNGEEKKQFKCVKAARIASQCLV